MENSVVFALDTNIFIEAHKRYYAFGILPAFWETLIKLARDGCVVSIDRVKNELDRGNDWVAEWANREFRDYFASTATEPVFQRYQQLLKWAEGDVQFKPKAIEDFASGDNADAWLIAYAAANNCVLVTHEVFQENVRSKIPIPNACKFIGVPYMNTFEMLQTLGVQFCHC